MALENLEDKIVLNAIPKSERKKIREFREQYFQFRKSWDNYLKRIKAYRKS